MTPNIPQEVRALAREIASSFHIGSAYEQIKDGLWDSSPLVRCAIAAIMEVTERAASLSGKEAHRDSDDLTELSVTGDRRHILAGAALAGMSNAGFRIAGSLRNWEHLKQ